LQDVTSGAFLPDGSVIVVDGSIGRLVRISPDGDASAARQPELEEIVAGGGFFVTEFGGGLQLCAQIGPTCRMIDTDGLTLSRPVAVSDRRMRARAVVQGERGLVAVATSSGGVLHELDSQGQLLNSFGTMAGVPSPGDSAVLNHGLGFALARSGTVFYAPFSMPALVGYARPYGEGDRIWQSVTDQPETAVTTGGEDGVEPRVLDTFPRTTGLVMSGGYVWLSAYAPDVDRSQLLAWRPPNVLRLKAELPFYAAVVAGSPYSQQLLIKRRIGTLELVVYAF
jgi:hypothetical protein